MPLPGFSTHAEHHRPGAPPRLAWRLFFWAAMLAGLSGVGLAITGRLPFWTAAPGALIALASGVAQLWGGFWRRFSGGTIRTRLLIGFLLITLLPALGISAGTILVGYYNGRQQAIDRLGSVALLKDLEVQSWVSRIQGEMSVAINEEFAYERASVVLKLAGRDQYYQTYNKAMRTRLRIYVAQSHELTELFLIDRQGRVVLSTDQAQEQAVLGQPPGYFDSLRGVTVLVSKIGGSERPPSLLVVMPVYTSDGLVMGAMGGRTTLESISRILEERTGLGETGKAYLVTSEGAMLVGQASGSSVKTAGSVGVLQTHTPGSGIYSDYRGVQVTGVSRWLPPLQAGLLVEQDLSEAFRAIYATLAVNLSIALAAVLLAVIASLFLTRGIARPLEELAETATQVAAGDLERTARVERSDEVGALALAFNSMTAQLRDLISGLERRVVERTEALQRRALQLETSAKVSRQATSILNIDDLLSQVVDLIRDAFGYYHVAIYLLDPGTGRLVHRASSGQIAPRLGDLEIGPGSLNGEVVRANQAVLVNDVQQDPRFLADPGLPETRAELALPLRLGETVIGTLDVHSAAAQAFNQEDVLVLQSLGDQVAIAIENARLYDQTRELAILEERNRLARELHDSVTQSLYSLSLLAEGWRRLARSGAEVHVEEYLARFGEIIQQALKEMRLLVYEMRPPVLEQEGLVAALRMRLDAVEQRAGVQPRLLADALLVLPAPIEEGLYWIAQEALNNALKHAAATAVTVRLEAGTQEVVFEVEDDGCGFPVPEGWAGGGMGLANMQARAAELGGSLEIISACGQGTTVRVRVPLEKPVREFRELGE